MKQTADQASVEVFKALLFRTDALAVTEVIKEYGDQRVADLEAVLNAEREKMAKLNGLSKKDWDLLVFALYHASGDIREKKPDTVDADTADELSKLADFFDTLVSRMRKMRGE